MFCCLFQLLFRELLNQSWMKPDKEDKAKHVLLVCKRFNEVCSNAVVNDVTNGFNSEHSCTRVDE